MQKIDKEFEPKKSELAGLKKNMSDAEAAKKEAKKTYDTAHKKAYTVTVTEKKDKKDVKT